MRTIGAYAAKTHLPRLLDEVAAGETIAITKRGRMVAMLVPPRDSRAEAYERIRQWREVRRGITLGPGLTIKQLVEEGRP